jgi:zinc/manganese transport system substrate-binding protein
MSSSHRRRLPLRGSAVLALAASCGDGGASSGGTGEVVVSTSILGDVVSEVAGDCLTVDVLIPPGVDPHGFEPSAAQAAELREADLVIINGLELEEQFESTIDSAADDGVEVFAVAEELDPLPLGDASEEDDHGDLDPHVWQDPERMARATMLIADELAAHTDCDPAELTERAETYSAEIRAVDAAIAQELDAIPVDQRVLVTNHDAFGYFADRYGFEVLGTVIPSGSTLAEPSSSELAALAELIVEVGVPAIFAETSQSTALAEALADETGRPVEVVELDADALGDEGSGAATYLELLQTNADRVVAALTG